MRRLLTALAVAAMTVGGSATAAVAAPADQAVVSLTEHVDGAHRHHVDTPAGCVEINAVYFEPAERGLHRGSNASGPDAGPFHNGC